jgi:spermidine synthase
MTEPDAVLVIGFGVGNTTQAVALHPSIRRIDVADLSRDVLVHAGYFRAWNRDVLDDPRLTVYINDGRQHLQMQPGSVYDLVTLEPPPIAYAGVGALYSKEFYALARSRLTPGGYISQWLPAPASDPHP